MRPMRFTSVLVLAQSLLLILPCDADQKDNKPSAAQKRDERRENEAVREAQDRLRDVEKELRQAETELRDAQQGVRQAVLRRQQAAAALQKTVDRLEGEHADLTGLTEARRTLKSLQTEFDEKASPIRRTLSSQTEYQAALAEVTRIKTALADAETTQTERQKLGKEQLAAAAKVRELEQAAFRRDTDLAGLLAKMDRAEKELQIANNKFEKAVERDGDLKSARKAFETAKSDEDGAEQSVVKKTRELSAARSKLAQATQQLQQKKLQDARDNNKPKKK